MPGLVASGTPYIKQATISKIHILMKNKLTLLVPDCMGMLC